MNEVSKIVSYSGIGKRSNNEDSYLISDNHFFLVCDGVGGAEKGEIASTLVVAEFQQILESDFSTSPEVALRAAEKKLTEHIQMHPESMGMATTLTFSKVTNEGVLVAWVGDSRIYQFRGGKIIFQTTDHSWVNDALRVGMITPEEAINHPKSNIITRAVQGEHKPMDMDIELVNDIRDGDFIFHCSDGVLEAWSNEELEYLFSTQSSAEEIIKSIEQKCGNISRDNNTAILYQLKSDNKPANNQYITNQEVFIEEVVEAIPMDENQFQNFAPKQNVESHEDYSNPMPSKFKFNKLLFIVSFLVIAIVIFFKVKSTSSKVEEKKSEITATESKAKKKGDKTKEVAEEKTEEIDPVKKAEKDGYTSTKPEEKEIENYEKIVVKDTAGKEYTMYKKKNVQVQNEETEEDPALKAKVDTQEDPKPDDKKTVEKQSVKDKIGDSFKKAIKKETTDKKKNS
jgi:serine/threonine protein phosphatase PrpC